MNLVKYLRPKYLIKYKPWSIDITGHDLMNIQMDAKQFSRALVRYSDGIMNRICRWLLLDNILKPLIILNIANDENMQRAKLFKVKPQLSMSLFESSFSGVCRIQPNVLKEALIPTLDKVLDSM